MTFIYYIHTLWLPHIAIQIPIQVPTTAEAIINHLLNHHGNVEANWIVYWPAGCSDDYESENPAGENQAHLGGYSYPVGFTLRRTSWMRTILSWTLGTLSGHEVSIYSPYWRTPRFNLGQFSFKRSFGDWEIVVLRARGRTKANTWQSLRKVCRWVDTRTRKGNTLCTQHTGRNLKDTWMANRIYTGQEKKGRYR